MSGSWLVTILIFGYVYGFNFHPLLWWLVPVLLWGDIRYAQLKKQ